MRENYRENYTTLENQVKWKDPYLQSGSYVMKYDENEAALIYASLPEEYSIFSGIDNKFFFLNDTDQHCFLSLCLQYLKTQLHIINAKYGVIRILPKLSITSDEDGAIVLNWAYANFRIFFNFETSIDSSYYGIVAQNSEDNIFSNIGKLNKANYTSIIDMILKYVIDNS